MHSFSDLLLSIGKALLLVNGSRWESAVLDNKLGEVAQNAWAAWSQAKSHQERLDELRALVQASGDQVRKGVDNIVAEIADRQPRELSQALARYLHQVWVMVRRHMPAGFREMDGSTFIEYLALEKPNHLLPFLPPRLSRFGQGDHPLTGVDW
jgi:hypothetical protein